MRLDSPEAELLFTALGNKTRRRMLQRLSEKPARSISELAREFGISSTAASKQIKLLEQAELVVLSLKEENTVTSQQYLPR